MKQVLQTFSRQINWFAVFYIAGLFIMVAGVEGDGMWWPFIRAVTWVLGVPAAMLITAVSTRKGEDKSAKPAPTRPSKPPDVFEKGWDLVDPTPPPKAQASPPSPPPTASPADRPSGGSGGEGGGTGA